MAGDYGFGSKLLEDEHGGFGIAVGDEVPGFAGGERVGGRADDYPYEIRAMLSDNSIYCLYAFLSNHTT